MDFHFPDGKKHAFTPGTTGFDLLKLVPKSVAKKAVALSLDGILLDLSKVLERGGHIKFMTLEDPEGLDILRHDAAHVFAQAVKELYPETQISIGPAIENGFYYDIYRPIPLTPEDLEKIESHMHAIVERDDPITREVWSREKALAFFASKKEHLKVEIIQDIPEDQPLSFYAQGDFIDLCRGPHMPSTRYVGKAFKLMKLAGAYWRGDANNLMLQRVYGTVWPTKKELEAYLFQIEEAEKRDHRKLGRHLDLFHFQDEAPGSVFWHPHGWTVYRLLQSYMRGRLEEEGYVEVNTPQLVDRSLWEASGHWEKFRDVMFGTGDTDDERLYLVKPMNCPCHVQIFNQGLKSYRDLPLRMAEFGSCHRNEPSGSLHGLMRVRAFTQDDAHIFCDPRDIESETVAFTRLLLSVYKDLGFEDVRVKLSDRPEVRAGDDDTWDKAEDALARAAQAAGLEYTLNPGEGAFYGPKLEFVLKDALGRDWQCGTLQVDFVLPERLKAYYIAEDGSKKRPVMLHRAILGSFERFLGILIEHYAGKLPFWLAPVQGVVAPITNQVDEYARHVYSAMKEAGFRVELDTRNEKISYKIREHSHQKIPYIFVVGAKEQEQGLVSVRVLGDQAQKMYPLEDLLETLRKMR